MSEVASTQFQSKLAHCGPRGLLRRPELVTAALEKSRGGVLVIHAPAGFGKTYVLTDIYRHLRDAKCDVAQLGFLPSGLAEISATGGGEAHDFPETRIAVDDLPDFLAARGRESCLLVDGYDAVIGADEMAAISRSLDEASGRVRFILGGRSRHRLPLPAELILHGRASFMGWRELSLGEGEVRSILGNAEEHELDATIQLTRGWPAMVRLAAMVLDESDDLRRREGFKSFLAGEDEHVRAYVYQAVLPSLRPYAQQMLGLGGFIDAICPDLARSLGVDGAGQTGGQDALAEAEPIIARANRRGWYRFHPAVSGILRCTFDRLAEEERQQRHLAAARWFSTHGHLEEAVYHAVETQDFSMAEACIKEAGGVRIFLRSGFPTLHRLMAQLPNPVILRSSALQLCQAVVFGKQGHLDSARELIDEVKKTYAAGDRQADVPSGDIHHIDTLIAAYEDRIADPDVMAILQDEAKVHSPRNLWRIGWIANHMSIAQTILGDFGEAEREAHKALTCYRQNEVGYALIFMLIHLGLISLDRGKPLSALNFLNEADSLMKDAQRSDRNVRAIAMTAIAQAQYAIGGSRKAEQLLDDALMTLPAGEAWVDVYERAFLTRARTAISEGATETALRLVDQAEQVSSQRRLGRLTTFACLLKMEVTLRTGLMEAASDIAGSLEWMADGDWPPGKIYREHGVQFTWREWHLCLLTMARVRWMQKRREEAVAYLEKLRRSAKSFDAGFDHAAATALLFCYHWHMRRTEEARTCFQQAIALATPQKLVSVFSDEGYRMAVATRGMLRKFGASAFSRATIEFTNDVLGAHLREEIVMPGGPHNSRVEIFLTDREREILEHLVRGLSNKAIALEIGRTEATVKYHLRRVFSKLGVHSRASAIVMAKDMAIVS